MACVGCESLIDNFYLAIVNLLINHDIFASSSIHLASFVYRLIF
jgi:hypothetical protein